MGEVDVKMQDEVYTYTHTLKILSPLVQRRRIYLLEDKLPWSLIVAFPGNGNTCVTQYQIDIHYRYEMIDRFINEDYLKSFCVLINYTYDKKKHGIYCNYIRCR
jgi:hypothetical protein